MPSGPTVTGLTGARASATRLPFQISDRVNASVDVATGNLLVTANGLSLPGVNSTVPVGAAYNSLSTTAGNTSTPAANGWTYNYAGAGNLSTVTGGLVLTQADGQTWKFASISGSQTAFTSPVGLNEGLTGTTSNGIVNGYTLVDVASRAVTQFDANGNPISVTDKNNNVVKIVVPTTTAGSVVTTAGPTTAQTATLSYANSTLAATQNSGGSTSRNVQFFKDSGSNLTKFTDASGKITSFGYTSGKLSSITNAVGQATYFKYNSGGLVNEIDQNNTTYGSTGTSITRLSYVSATQTLVADANTDSASAVSAVAHSTYTLTPAHLVADVTDPLGREQAATYNAANSGALTVTSGTGGDQGVSKNTYNANGNQSQTSAQSASGSTSTAAYTNTPSNTKYSPSSTTDDTGAVTAYQYNGTGNLVSNTTTAAAGGSGSPATAASAVLTTNPDGTVATATAPRNAGNPTKYTYSNHQVTVVTAPTGNTLGVKTTTYDTFGRPATQTDGKNVTITYGYDNNDRLLSTNFSDTTHSIVNTYDAVGRMLTSADANGTTTNTFDQLGRLTATVNSAGGGQEQYSYDKASNLLKTADTRGTSYYDYDAGNVAKAIRYTISGTNYLTNFQTDSRGRRTDTWLATNSGNTTWQDHMHTAYDASGRIVESVGQTGTGNTSNKTVYDNQYCYNSATAAPTCGTAQASDHAKLQWSLDKLTGQITTYGYDVSGHLTSVVQSGGTAANNTFKYSYDTDGNRINAVVTGATPSAQSLTYNSADQITTSGYSYDGAGNLTKTPTAAYTYNGAEQMTNAVVNGAAASYTYAGASQTKVLSETGPNGTYTLTYGRADQNGNAVIEQYKEGSTTAWVENDGATGAPVLLRTGGGIEGLYVNDGIGNPIAILTYSALPAYTLSFDPYGVEVVTSGSNTSAYAQNPFTFKGGIQDRASGLVKFGIRWYDPTTGRWTQQDTLDAPLDARNANRYAYAGDDPVNLIDLVGNLTTAQQCGLAFLGITTLLVVVVAGATIATGGAAAAAVVGEAAASTATTVGTASGFGVGIVGGLAAIFGC